MSFIDGQLIKMDEKNLSISLGSRIRLLRRRAKMTQGELASKLGFSQRYISAIETGRALAATDHLFAMCIIFNVRLGAFDPGISDYDVLSGKYDKK